MPTWQCSLRSVVHSALSSGRRKFDMHGIDTTPDNDRYSCMWRYVRQVMARSALFAAATPPHHFSLAQILESDATTTAIEDTRACTRRRTEPDTFINNTK